MELQLVGKAQLSGYAERRLAEFAEHCRAKGLAVTPQRLAVIKALLACLEHPRADAIYETVRREHPHISLATVHRTLETLCDMGEARKVTMLYDSARYDGNVTPHHHVICVGCRCVRDVEIPDLAAVLNGCKAIGDFKVLGGSLEIQALCPRCARNGGRRARGAARSDSAAGMTSRKDPTKHRRTRRLS
jgi:Fur family transcriptional regulator, peroxide stress response regulator